MALRLYLGLIMAVLLQLVPSINHAAEKHALVIGNSNYKILSLKNPVNDAIDMSAQLQSMGYNVYTDGPLLDLDRVEMERAIDNFSQSLPVGASAVFYYAGHGMATGGDNYLLPINTSLEFQSQLKDRTVGLRSIVELLKSYNPDGTNVFLLDACRNNPLTRSFRGVQRGLKTLEDIPRGVFIGYAAENGKVANDNATEDNGTYTGQLLESMAANPQLSIIALHKEVANAVYKKTNGEQFPVSEDRVVGKWCFADCGASSTAPPGIDETDQEVTLTEDPTIDVAIKPTRNYWKIAAGALLGLAVIAIATDKDDSDPQGRVDVLLPVPGG